MGALVPVSYYFYFGPWYKMLDDRKEYFKQMWRIDLHTKEFEDWGTRTVSYTV